MVRFRSDYYTLSMEFWAVFLTKSLNTSILNADKDKRQLESVSSQSPSKGTNPMQVTLEPEMEQQVQHKIASGEYPNTDTLLNEALRRFLSPAHDPDDPWRSTFLTGIFNPRSMGIDF